MSVCKPIYEYIRNDDSNSLGSVKIMALCKQDRKKSHNKNSGIGTSMLTFFVQPA